MNKNVIALAVAAAMAAPLAAQAEVTVSGTMQAEVVSNSGDVVTEGLYMTDGQTYGSTNNSSGVGALVFSASEDLGNGMKSMVKYAMNISTDGGYNGERDAYIGLSGGFGTILAGTMSTPYATSTGSYDPFKATFAQARGNGGMQNGVFGNGSYLTDALAYANKFGMAKVVLAVGIDDSADGGATPAWSSTNANNAMSASVVMPVGPVEIAVAMLNATDYANSTGAAGKDRSQMKVGVKYTAGAITVAAQHETSDVSVSDGTYTYLTGSYGMGANTFSASYGAFAADATTGGTSTIGSEAWGATDATYMAVGMKHAFSKKTSVTVAYRSTAVDEAAGDTVDRDQSAIGASMRVKF